MIYSSKIIIKPKDVSFKVLALSKNCMIYLLMTCSDTSIFFLSNGPFLYYNVLYLIYSITSGSLLFLGLLQDILLNNKENLPGEIQLLTIPKDKTFK